MKNWRETCLFSLFSLLLLLILARAFFWQIVKADYYRALSLGIYHNFPKNTQERGEVYFRDGTPLILNEYLQFIFIFPEKVKEKEKLKKILSEIFSFDPLEIERKFSKKTPFSFFGKFTSQQLFILEKEKIEGVVIDEGIKRKYPYGEVTANVTGFLGGENRGQYGIEEYYDKNLSEGEDLILTLDPEIQYKAFEILKIKKEEIGYERGHILVMNPQNGEILAMATYPTFNPNFYSETKDIRLFKNPFSQEVFEPGSIFKVVTMAIGLEEKKITPETTYEDPGEIIIDGWRINNYANRKYPGKITMTEVLEKSINTGAVFVAQKIPINSYLEYLEKLGIFEKTGVDLPETVYLNSELKKGRRINFLTTSFGQGIALTPLQVAKIFSAICNEGKMVTPHLVGKYQKNEEKLVFSKDTVNNLTKMMISVVENGFAKKARIKGYFIGGKTGTSLQPKFGEPGYSDKTWQSFIGCFPALKPQYLILIKLDNPQTKTAEYSAVPIFREIASFIIQTKQIPPDYEKE